jgi:hypothetical protein
MFGVAGMLGKDTESTPRSDLLCLSFLRDWLLYLMLRQCYGMLWCHSLFVHEQGGVFWTRIASFSLDEAVGYLVYEYDGRSHSGLLDFREPRLSTASQVPSASRQRLRLAFSPTRPSRMPTCSPPNPRGAIPRSLSLPKVRCPMV